MNYNRFAANLFKLGHSAVIQSETKLLKAGLKTSVVRSQKVQYSPLSPKLKAKMDRFQIEDGVPIHLKGGFMDIVLYSTTLFACLAGIIGSLDYIYHSSFPKKPDGEC